MIIRTANDLGHLIRDQRRQAKLTQEQLARRVGVSRKWIVDIEGGKRTAELSLALRTLRALGIDLDARQRRAHHGRNTPDLDAIIDAAKKPRS